MFFVVTSIEVHQKIVKVPNYKEPNNYVSHEFSTLARKSAFAMKALVKIRLSLIHFEAHRFKTENLQVRDQRFYETNSAV